MISFSEEKMSQDFVTIKTTGTAQPPAPVTIDKPLLTKDKDLIQQEEENTFRKPNPVRQRESPPKTCKTLSDTIHDTDNSNNETLTHADTNSHLDKTQKVPDDKENTTPQQNAQQTDSEVILRRTHSFESDDA